MGENANQIQKCESLSLLIATDQEEFINEVVGVDLGSELFHVRVSELCPWILGTRLRDRPIMSTPSSESEARSSVEVESKNFSELIRSKYRSWKVIFSRPVMGVGAAFIELSAVKTVLGVFDETVLGKEVDLVVESIL
ncbi:hypothetical protein V6N12_057596 [Hibiscus sabdariffa]|uniref:Uncharacterized protein n=1 Tax=Hibiscus sabdariffa TaxID=183260 RepID=A0ABR2C5N4_9ROSI